MSSCAGPGCTHPSHGHKAGDVAIVEDALNVRVIEPAPFAETPTRFDLERSPVSPRSVLPHDERARRNAKRAQARAARRRNR